MEQDTRTCSVWSRKAHLPCLRLIIGSRHGNLTNGMPSDFPKFRKLQVLRPVEGSPDPFTPRAVFKCGDTRILLRALLAAKTHIVAGVLVTRNACIVVCSDSWLVRVMSICCSLAFEANCTPYRWPKRVGSIVTEWGLLLAYTLCTPHYD
jgi:hypothetical protein